MNHQLATIEAHYDAVPRPVADVHEVGPFTLFRAHAGTGWQFYARPRLGETIFTADDVRAVLAAQTDLGVPRAIEWVHETTPALLPAVRAATAGLPGVELEECPLLALPPGDLTGTPDRRVRLLSPDDDRLPDVVGAVSAAFAGHDDAVAKDPGLRRRLIDDGLLVMAGAFVDDVAVGGGSAAPRGDAAELMGIAVLPGARGSGLATGLTRALVGAVRARGCQTVLLSAASDDAARIYRRIGFTDVGTACILGVE